MKRKKFRRFARNSFLLQKFADADPCVPYDNIEKGIELLNNGYDIAFGSRTLRNSRALISQLKYRQIGSTIFSLIVKIFMKIREVKDTQFSILSKDPSEILKN